MSKVAEEKIAWIKYWERVGPALAERQRLEHRRMTLTQRQQQIADLLDLAQRFRQPRRDFGLVILKQRLTKIFGK